MALGVAERSWPYSMRGRALGKFHLSGGIWKAPKPTSYIVPGRVDSQACASSSMLFLLTSFSILLSFGILVCLDLYMVCSLGLGVAATGKSSHGFDVPMSSVQDVLRRMKLEAAKKASSGSKVSAAAKLGGKAVKVSTAVPEDSAETKSGKGKKRKLNLDEEDTYSEQAKLTSGLKYEGVRLLDEFRRTVDGDALMGDSLNLAFQNVGETSKLLQSALAAAHSSVLLKLRLETVERELSEADQCYHDKEAAFDELKAKHSTNLSLLESTRAEGHRKDEQLASLNGQIDELKSKLINEATMWYLRGRLQAMSESEEERSVWDLENEISVFDLCFPGLAWGSGVDGPSGAAPKDGSEDGESDSPEVSEGQAVPIADEAGQSPRAAPVEVGDGKAVPGAGGDRADSEAEAVQKPAPSDPAV